MEFEFDPFSLQSDTRIEGVTAANIQKAKGLRMLGYRKGRKVVPTIIHADSQDLLNNNLMSSLDKVRKLRKNAEVFNKKRRTKDFYHRTLGDIKRDDRLNGSVGMPYHSGANLLNGMKMAGMTPENLTDYYNPAQFNVPQTLAILQSLQGLIPGAGFSNRASAMDRHFSGLSGAGAIETLRRSEPGTRFRAMNTFRDMLNTATTSTPVVNRVADSPMRRDSNPEQLHLDIGGRRRIDRQMAPPRDAPPIRSIAGTQYNFDRDAALIAGSSRVQLHPEIGEHAVDRAERITLGLTQQNQATNQQQSNLQNMAGSLPQLLNATRPQQMQQIQTMSQVMNENIQIKQETSHIQNLDPPDQIGINSAAQEIVNPPAASGSGLSPIKEEEEEKEVREESKEESKERARPPNDSDYFADDQRTSEMDNFIRSTKDYPYSAPWVSNQYFRNATGDARYFGGDEETTQAFTKRFQNVVPYQPVQNTLYGRTTLKRPERGDLGKEIYGYLHGPGLGGNMQDSYVQQMKDLNISPQSQMGYLESFGLNTSKVDYLNFRQQQAKNGEASAFYDMETGLYIDPQDEQLASHLIYRSVIKRNPNDSIYAYRPTVNEQMQAEMENAAVLNYQDGGKVQTTIYEPVGGNTKYKDYLVASVSNNKDSKFNVKYLIHKNDIGDLRGKYMAEILVDEDAFKQDFRMSANRNGRYTNSFKYFDGQGRDFLPHWKQDQIDKGYTFHTDEVRPRKKNVK